jgi:hypothetical protein
MFMRQRCSLLTCATVFMLAILLHLSLLSGFTGAGADVTAGGVEIAQAQGDGSGQTTTPDDRENFKPPKQSFVDYSDFLLASCILPPVTRSETGWSVDNRSGFPPEIYLDIFIPPDQLV